MDLMTGLATVQQAIGIAKELRDLEKNLDSATYKAQIAELYSSLADVKMALTDAQTALHDKDRQIRELTSKIEDMRAGETCPICGKGRMKVVASRPHPHFSFAGVQERSIKCQNPECGHTEDRLFDPDNRTGTNSG